MFFDKGSGNYGYDIGILVLERAFILNKNVQVAELPSIGPYCPSGETLFVSGWGRERQSSNYIQHQYLWAVKQNCVDIDKCTSYNGERDAIICAGGPKDLRDTSCIGDSGGDF